MKTIGLIYGGAGSAAVAARQLDLEVLFNFETRGDHYLKTFKKNFLNSLTFNNKDRLLDYLEIDIPDILIGQPDCKNYSNLQTKIKEKKDFTSTQLWEYLKIIQELLPDTWIVENLKLGIEAAKEYLDLHSKFDIKFNTLTDEKLVDVPLIDYYNISIIELNTIYFLPQSRNRFFIIGKKKPANFKFKAPIIKNEKGVRSILKELEDPDSYKIFKNHRIANHSQERVKGFSKLKYGESYYGTQNNRKLDPNECSGVITSHCTQLVHYKFPRTLTCRENARLMGWPDDFEFIGNNTQCLDMAGKAISIPVIKYILNQVIER